MADIDITVSGDNRDILKEQARTAKSVEDLEKKYQRLLRNTKKETRQAKTELERFAAATTKINRTPAEKYRETVRKLNQALRQGLINQTTYNRAIARAKSEERGVASPATTARFAALAGAIAIVVGGLKKTYDLFEKVKQQANEFASTQRLASAGLGELAQVADRKTPLTRLIALTKQTFREGGFQGETSQGIDESAKLVFALKSAGALDQRALFSRIAQARLARDPTAFISSAAALNRSIGEQETGGFRSLISKAFGASAFAPARAEEILLAAARGGTSARTLGISDEQLLAGTAVLSEARGNAPEGGTLIASLLKSLEKRGEFKGKTILQSIDEIKKKGLDDAQLFEFFGRQEAVAAFKILDRSRGRFRTATEAITRAERVDEVGRRIREFEKSDVLRADLLRRRGEAARELSAQQVGARANVAQALINEDAAAARQAGFSETWIHFRRILRETQRTIAGDARFIGSHVGGGRIARETRQSLNRNRLVEDRMERAAQNLEKAAGKLDNAAGNFEDRQQFANGQRQDQARHGGAVEAK